MKKANDFLVMWAMAFLSSLIFQTFKSIGFIDWSWWWILSPLLFALAVTALAAVILIIWFAVFYSRDMETEEDSDEDIEKSRRAMFHKKMNDVKKTNKDGARTQI